MSKLQSKSKSPLTLSLLIACLVISTLVMISNYFFRPGLESDLENKVISTLFNHNIFNAAIMVKGRDVVLTGVASNAQEIDRIEAEINNISGIHEIENNLLAKDQFNMGEQK